MLVYSMCTVCTVCMYGVQYVLTVCLQYTICVCTVCMCTLCFQFDIKLFFGFKNPPPYLNAYYFVMCSVSLKDCGGVDVLMFVVCV